MIKLPISNNPPGPADPCGKKDNRKHCSHSYKIYRPILSKAIGLCKYILTMGVYILNYAYNRIFVHAYSGISLMHGPFCSGEY